MTETETILSVLHGPAIPLSAVCDTYFGITSYKEACRKAAVCELPVPTFKLRESERAPYLIHAKDLAAWIDSQAQAARVDWQHCQVDGPVPWLVQLSQLEAIVGASKPAKGG